MNFGKFNCGRKIPNYQKPNKAAKRLNSVDVSRALPYSMDGEGDGVGMVMAWAWRRTARKKARETLAWLASPILHGDHAGMKYSDGKEIRVGDVVSMENGRAVGTVELVIDNPLAKDQMGFESTDGDAVMFIQDDVGRVCIGAVGIGWDEIKLLSRAPEGGEGTRMQ